MSEDAQREEKKELLLKWKENEQELARQKVVASRMADVLSHVARMLRSEPTKLVFSDDSTPMQYVGAPIITDARDLDLPAIKKVRDALRGLEERQRDLKPQMATFGLL